MRITLFVAILLILHQPLRASDPPTDFTVVQIAYGSKVLVINGELLYANDLFSKYVEAIGIYDRVVPSGTYLTFYFDNQGITILVNKETGRVIELNFQYLPQRGSRSTIAMFNGQIIVNDRSLDSFQSVVDVRQHFKTIEFTEVMDVLVMTQRDNFNIGVVFTQDNELELCSIQFF